mmetsp:Transcript_8848/g.21629  ORF Transcript_8848/g.21629 Transcript_8848/m.21629 type:complete len:302 (-) Transcript_8848:165-1070(-)
MFFVVIFVIVPVLLIVFVVIFIIIFFVIVILHLVPSVLNSILLLALRGIRDEFQKGTTAFVVCIFPNFRKHIVGDHHGMTKGPFLVNVTEIGQIFEKESRFRKPPDQVFVLVVFRKTPFCAVLPINDSNQIGILPEFSNDAAHWVFLFPSFHPYPEFYNVPAPAVQLNSIQTIIPIVFASQFKRYTIAVLKKQLIEFVCGLILVGSMLFKLECVHVFVPGVLPPGSIIDEYFFPFYNIPCGNKVELQPRVKFIRPLVDRILQPLRMSHMASFAPLDSSICPFSRRMIYERRQQAIGTEQQC